MTEQVNQTPSRPRRLDIKDMPRDTKRDLGSLRTALISSFNFCRSYPRRLEVLRETLVYVISRIDAYNEILAADEEKREKRKAGEKKTLRETLAELVDEEELEKWALETYNIDLDKRRKLDGMKEDLITALKAKAQNTEGGDQ